MIVSSRSFVRRAGDQFVSLWSNERTRTRRLERELTFPSSLLFSTAYVPLPPPPSLEDESLPAPPEPELLGVFRATSVAGNAVRLKSSLSFSLVFDLDLAPTFS